MRLTSFTDYGLRMLMRMASAPERVYSTADLADEFGLPRNHLLKIVQRLAKSGYVKTRRGGGGGARLARPAAEIRLGEVVRALEEDHALVECLHPCGGNCTLTAYCRLQPRLQAAEATFLAELDRSTLADIALEPGTATADQPAVGCSAHGYSAAARSSSIPEGTASGRPARQ